MRRLRVAGLTAFLLVFLAIPACADIVTNGTGQFTGQGFGTLYNLLVLHNNGTETGAVAPTNASPLPSGFGTCSVKGGVDLCGDATNSSDVVTAADLAALGITSFSQLGLLYNVNQQGSDLNTYLTATPAFTLYFYNSSGNLLGSDSYTPGQTAFPPTSNNGQGTAGWLFKVNDASITFSQIANIGMSGTVGNANSGADGWSVGNTGAVIPVPDGGVTAILLGGALVGLETLRRKFRA